MNGDVIRRIEQCKDIIGHVQWRAIQAGANWMRTRKFSTGSIMRKLVEIGYQGYVRQEFIPTRNPMVGLRQAVTLCDV